MCHEFRSLNLPRMFVFQLQAKLARVQSELQRVTHEYEQSILAYSTATVGDTSIQEGWVGLWPSPNDNNLFQTGDLQ